MTLVLSESFSRQVSTAVAAPPEFGRVQLRSMVSLGGTVTEPVTIEKLLAPAPDSAQLSTVAVPTVPAPVTVIAAVWVVNATPVGKLIVEPAAGA